MSVILFMGMLGEERPNVVFIVVDTLRADAVSTKIGNLDTPNIAELAAHGVEYPLAFTHAPMTLPAHASLFSGRHPYETGVYNNGEQVPTDVPLLAESLHESGYQTAAVVSLATLWPQGKRMGLDRGFEIFDTGDKQVAPAEDTSRRISGVLDSLDPERPFFLFAHLADPHEPYNEHAPYFEGEAKSNTAKVSLDGERIRVVTTSVMSWWEQEVTLEPGVHQLHIESSAPFKLRALEALAKSVAVPVNFERGALHEIGEEVIVTLENPSDEAQTVQLRAWINDIPAAESIRRRYASEVRAADAAIGKLIRDLRERGLWDNTLIVLTSDHGEALGEHGTVGHVVNLYDELLHVPLIMKFPGDERDLRIMSTRRDLVRHVDIAPTVMELIDRPNLDGASGVSLFQQSDRSLIAETHPPEAPRTLMALRDAKYKLIFDPAADSFELFRLGPDPLEQNNVFSHQGHLRTTWELVLRRLAAEIEPSEERDQELQSRLTALGY